MKFIIASVLLSLVILGGNTNAQKNILCYVGTWAVYRHGNGNFEVGHIDPQICTHLVYTFFGIEETGAFRVLDPYLDLEENYGRGNIKKFNALKHLNPKLKTLAAVGGWNEGSIKYSNAAKDPAKRRRFIETAVAFILKHNFDGLDFDWEYPGQRGGDSAVDKQNYVIWLKELKEELSKNGLLLSAAVASAEFSASQSYDIPKISQYLDLINIMVYDLHGPWDESLGINAPLNAGPADVTETEKQLNVHSSIQYWLKQGAPAHKINLGIPLYGHTFTLSDKTQIKPGSAHRGPGSAGKYTQQPGSLGYNEFCEDNKSGLWKMEWEETQQVPYAIKADQWFGYDNKKSVELKAHYVNKYNLGGAMVWSLETDDFRGICEEKYPLMNTIKKTLDSTASPDPPTTVPPSVPTTTETTTRKSSSTTTTKTSSTTSRPTTTTGPEFQCKQDGTFRDPYDCAVFYVCSHGTKHTFRCPSDLWFDTIASVCNFKHLVNCSPIPLPQNTKIYSIFIGSYLEQNLGFHLKTETKNKMKFISIILNVLVTLVVVSAIAAEKKKIVCYVGTWATYRWGNGKFDVDNIYPHLCTHLVYSFFGINENGDLRIIDPYLDLEENWGRGNIKKFNALKEKNPNLKTIAAVGGWNEGSVKFSEVAKDPVKRRRFIDTAIEFVLKYNFDGIDMDWEYPAQRGGDVAVDKANFVNWLKEFRTEVDKHGLLLTAAVASAEFSASQSYDIPKLSKYLDFINIMAYDLHGSWDDITGINAPLYSGDSDITAKQKQLNVHNCVQYWLKQGAPANKIILGVPLYGRTFTLENTHKTAPGSPISGGGNAGQYTGQAGFLGYNEICEKLEKGNWNQKWDEKQKVPYAFSGNQWVGYDNEKSLALKAQYVNEHNLGGIMVWSLETDDFNGVCGSKYPLMNAINQVLWNGVTIPPEQSTTTTVAPATTSASSTTQTAPIPTSSPESIKCSENGLFRDLKDCSVFHICSNGISHSFKCPANLWFDINIKTCNFRHLVDCKITKS
ncbi:probable endochitinase [Condylostylus longicornis]|uniref:probable endochitinase n=1 Tax=Condylostylus longicornis TaxID=2530218 RepID=UPI00244E1844|nr:probable endochitinase [Condylostylus longicornis]